MKSYLRILAALYAIGAVLHLADILNLRLHFSQMTTTWKIWIWYLFLFDSVASIGLWFEKRWGQLLFVIIAFTQLAAYLGFQAIFGMQDKLVIFHLVTLLLYFCLLFSRWVRRARFS